MGAEAGDNVASDSSLPDYEHLIFSDATVSFALGQRARCQCAGIPALPKNLCCG